MMHGRIKILVEAGVAWASERKEREGKEEAAKFEISYPRVLLCWVCFSSSFGRALYGEVQIGGARKYKYPSLFRQVELFFR